MGVQIDGLPGHRHAARVLGLRVQDVHQRCLVTGRGRRRTPAPAAN